MTATGRSPIETVVRSLHFQLDRSHLVREIPDAAWPALLQLTDDARLTLPLAIRCRDSLPPAVQRRLDRNLARNAERHSRVVADWQEIAGALAARGVECVLLKGLTHWPNYSDEPWHRPQYDIDLYCPEVSIGDARDAIATLGYVPLRPDSGPPADHLPAMIRKNGYQWTGDYFDPDLPLLVELHYRLWNPEREAFPVRNAGAFWERRTTRAAGGVDFPALHPVDTLSYAAWHAVRHLLRGDLRLYHIYEIAHFLDKTADHQAFWCEWRRTHAADVCLAEPIAFRLAVEWFGCRVNAVVAEQVAGLPVPVPRWFNLFAFSPIRALEQVNKDELFLHLSLVTGRRERLRIAAQRVFPRNPPAVILHANVAGGSAFLGLRRSLFRARFLIGRAARHIRALWSVLRSGILWWTAA